MQIAKYTLVVLLTGLLFGCASDDEPQGVIPEQQLKALEKAKGAEQMLLDAAEKRQEEMEKKGI